MSLACATGQRIRILHLEDDCDHSELVRYHIARANVAFDYDRVTSKDDYTSALRHKSYDLILADYSLPQMDGLQAYNLANEQCPDIPFVVVTSGVPPESVDRCFQRGAMSFLSKDNLGRLGPIVRHALRQSQNRYERERMQLEWTQFITLAHDCFCVIAPDGYFKRLSPAWERLTGFPEETLKSTTFSHFLHVDERVHVEAELRQLTAGALERCFEARFACRDGSWRWLQWNAVVSHESPLIYATARDISTPKAAEDRIREQAQLLDLAQDAISLWDPAGRITYWNKGAERLYGWTAGQVIGKPAAEILDGLNRGPVRAGLAADGVWKGELSQKNSAGSVLTVEARLNVVRDAAGHPKSHLYIANDITEKKELQTKFLRAQRLDSIGSMASGIAHDLNNIFTPILLAAGVLESMLPPEPQQRRLLSAVKASAERGGDLVKQILSFTRGGGDSDGAVDVRKIISDLTGVLDQTFPKSIRIEVKVADDLAPILANATQLHQVLLNLCVNARDAMANGGVLRIQANNFSLGNANQYPEAKRGPYVQLTVTDTGSGIPLEVRDHIFDPFFTTKAPGEGTGLGLHTVRNIIVEHGGFIDLKSEVGNGTEFRVFFPAVHCAPPAALRAAKPVAAGGQGETILLVDDERGILEMTEALLKRAGYQTITAPGGPQALAAFTDKSINIDLVLIDVVMPLLDGPATIRAFQNLHPDVPVIAMSGLAENQKRVEELKNTRFLLKPFSPNDLLTAIKEALAAG
jgi:PAS domain S-box-containing protein